MLARAEHEAQHSGLAVAMTGIQLTRQPLAVIKLTTSQHQPGEPRPTLGSVLWRALRRGARAAGDFHAEQVHYWDRYFQASRTLVPHDGPLAWVLLGTARRPRRRRATGDLVPAEQAHPR